MSIKILAGITQENELYFIEIDPMIKDKDYFGMSGFTIKPIEESEGEALAREMLEDGEMWKMAVESGNTTAGLNDWIDDVLAIDGWQNTIDCSLYPDSFLWNGETYYFESGACGQHEEKDLKHYLIDKKNFDWLMEIWKKYHLKKEIIILPEWIEQTEKNEDKQIKRAFELLEKDGEI